MKHKCKYCHEIMIKDLEEFLKTDKSLYVMCPNCDGLTWKRELGVKSL